MHKYHRVSSVTYGLALPSIVSLLAVLALVTLWRYDRCRVWRLDDDVIGALIANTTAALATDSPTPQRRRSSLKMVVVEEGEQEEKQEEEAKETKTPEDAV